MRIKFEPGRISASQACRWAGVKDGSHRPWVAQGLIPASGKTGYDLDGIVELYVLSQLIKVLGFERARRCWLRVRDQLPDFAEPIAYLKLVCGEAAPIGELTRSPDELDVAVSSGEPVRVVDLLPMIKRVRDWHGTEVQAQWSGASRPRGVVSGGGRRTAGA